MRVFLGHTFWVVFGRTVCAWLSILFGIVVLLGAAGNPNGETRDFSGEARNPKSGELLYTEFHVRQINPDGSVDIETVYRNPAGTPFATRSVRLSTEGFLPTYHFRDARTGYEEGVRLREGSPVMFRKRPDRDGIEEKAIPDNGIIVADAGFDRLVELNWDRLMSGETVEANMVVPSRLRTFRFKVVKVGESEIDGDPVATFRMVFSSPLLRLLAPKLLVSYHRDDHSIVAFDGKSSLEDPDGGNYSVNIRYQRKHVD